MESEEDVVNAGVDRCARGSDAGTSVSVANARLEDPEA